MADNVLQEIGLPEGSEEILTDTNTEPKGKEPEKKDIDPGKETPGDETPEKDDAGTIFDTEEPEDKDPGKEEPEDKDPGKEEPEKKDIDFKEYFPGYNSVEDVKKVVESVKTFETELKKKEQLISGLQQEVNQLKSQNPFKNEKLYRLDRLSEKEPDKTIIYQRYLFGDNSDEEVIKLKMMIDHPKIFNENPGYLQRKINEKFSALYSEDYTEGDVEYQDALTSMKIEAEEARKWFDSKIKEVEVPKPKSEEEIKKENEEFVKSWQDSFKEVKEKIKKITIPVLDEKDQSKTQVFMEYEIPDEDLKKVNQIAAEHILSNRLEPTEENIEQARQVALGIYLVNNFAKINTVLLNQIQKETGAKWRKKVNNPQKPGADVKSNNVESPDTETEDAIVSEISGI